MSLLMPVAVVVVPWLFVGNNVWPSPQLVAWYLAFWAAQAVAWKSQAPALTVWLGTALCTSLVSYSWDVIDLVEVWTPFIVAANGLALCWTLYFYLFSSRPGTSIADWYSGIDLHPLVWGIDIKLFIVSRIGMMGWGMACIVAVHTWPPGEVPLSTWASVLVQLAYITRFFHWEGPYVNTMDQQHDRAGFYITWGCQVYLPAMYWLASVQGSTIDGLVAVTGPGLGDAASLVWLFIGLVSLAAVHEIDDQKIKVRRNPHAFVARRPATYIKTKVGTLLLTCGAWGTARHMHYAFEFLCALAWTAPVAAGRWYGYLYPAYLAVLLVNRTYRDDERCLKRYGSDWEEYCKLVPYRILPGIF